MAQTESMDLIDRKLLDIIQTDFPLVPRPYEELGIKLGISEEEALCRVKSLKEKKIIRRLGANFQSAKLGFRSTLCGAHVPEEKLDAFIADVNALPGVTHNYLRNHVQRDFSAARMEPEAAVALAPSLEISSTRLALIPHYSQEILCYELRGTADGQEYLVYLNAETGAAEEILQVVVEEEGEAVV